MTFIEVFSQSVEAQRRGADVRLIIKAPTREQRIQMWCDRLTGAQPVGPNKAAVAAILAHRIVDLEDMQPDA